MNATFKGVDVADKDILAAMRNFDAQYSDTNQYDSWLEKGNYKYAIQHGDRLYPCKHILSETTGIGTSEFNGGEETNRVFRQLGFQVVKKPKLRSARTR